MNGYVCLYNGKRFECHAATTLEAQNKAALHFGKKGKSVKDPWMISTILAEKNGEQVVHSTAGL